MKIVQFSALQSYNSPQKNKYSYRILHVYCTDQPDQVFAKKGWTKLSLRSLSTWYFMIIWFCDVYPYIFDLYTTDLYFENITVYHKITLLPILLCLTINISTCYKMIILCRPHIYWYVFNSMFCFVLVFFLTLQLSLKIVPFFQFFQVTALEGWLDFFSRPCFFHNSMRFLDNYSSDSVTINGVAVFSITH